MAVPLQVNDFYDLEIVQSLASKLGCSIATTYRILKEAEVPIYYIPGRPASVLLQRASLWRIAKTPQWKKYLKRLGYEPPGKIALRKIVKKYPCATLFTTIKSNILALTFQDAIAAVTIGLIPVFPNSLNIRSWYLDLLRGDIVFPLPRKK